MYIIQRRSVAQQSDSAVCVSTNLHYFGIAAAVVQWQRAACLLTKGQRASSAASAAALQEMHC